MHTNHLSTQHSSDHQPATGRSKIYLCTCSIPIYAVGEPARRKTQDWFRPRTLPHHLSAGSRHKELPQLCLRITHTVGLNCSCRFYSTVSSAPTKEPVMWSWDSPYLFTSKMSLNQPLITQQPWETVYSILKKHLHQHSKQVRVWLPPSWQGTGVFQIFPVLLCSSLGLRQHNATG